MDGAVAGALSSLTTTLCNIFFTTAKRAVRILRQTYASLVQAAKVLFLNPDNLPFGERLRAVSKILATGASIAAGILVSEALETTGIGAIPVAGEIITSFCGSLVTGIMTCSLLYFFDRSAFMNKLVEKLNGIPTMSADVNFYSEQAAKFEAYAAELAQIDLIQFQEEIHIYNEIAMDINSAASENELNKALHHALVKINAHCPWQGDLSEFFANPDQRLVFA